jgi:hypothetical protein
MTKSTSGWEPGSPSRYPVQRLPPPRSTYRSAGTHTTIPAAASSRTSYLRREPPEIRPTRRGRQQDRRDRPRMPRHHPARMNTTPSCDSGTACVGRCKEEKYSNAKLRACLRWMVVDLEQDLRFVTDDMIRTWAPDDLWQVARPLTPAPAKR